MPNISLGSIRPSVLGYGVNGQLLTHSASENSLPYITAATTSIAPTVLGGPPDSMQNTVYDIEQNGVIYRVHKYVRAGVFRVISLGSSDGTIEFLGVGQGGTGGGTGGTSGTFVPLAGGGGGGGQYIQDSMIVTTGKYDISMAGLPGVERTASGRGSQGGNTIFSRTGVQTLVSLAGGTGGGSPSAFSGSTVSSSASTGGAATQSTSSGQFNSGTVGTSSNGNIGGEGFGGGSTTTNNTYRVMGGGGGAGSPGGSGVRFMSNDLNKGGDGGDGIQSDFDGTLRWYAAGGGGGASHGNNLSLEFQPFGGSGGNGAGGNGGSRRENTQPTGGEDGTGSGGGGGWGNGDFRFGIGTGNGVFIIRYPIGVA